MVDCNFDMWSSWDTKLGLCWVYIPIILLPRYCPLNMIGLYCGRLRNRRKGVRIFKFFPQPGVAISWVHKVHYTCHGGYKTVANIFEIVFLYVDDNIVRFHVGYITARYSVTAPPNATNWSSQASQAPHGPAATSCCWIKARAIITRRCLVDSCFMGAVVAVAQYQGVL